MPSLWHEFDSLQNGGSAQFERRPLEGRAALGCFRDPESGLPIFAGARPPLEADVIDATPARQRNESNKNAAINAFVIRRRRDAQNRPESCATPCMKRSAECRCVGFVVQFCEEEKKMMLSVKDLQRGSLVLSAAFLACSCSGVPNTDRSQAAAQRSAATAPPTSAGALPTGNSVLVYRDPVTGLRGDPPAGMQAGLTGGQAAVVNTSSAGLQEVRSPGGGTMVDLKGRFQSFSRVHVDAHGKRTFDCTNGDASGVRP